MSEQGQAAEAAAQDTPEQAEFRAHCREWLKNNHPGQPPRTAVLDPERLAADLDELL